MDRIKFLIERLAWKIFNSKLAIILVLVVFGFLPIVFPSSFLQQLPLLNFLIEHLTPDFWQNLIAAIIIAWSAYIWRVRIRRFFQPRVTYVRAPLMLGVAPLIIAKTEGIWEQHGLNMDLDFRYAGKGALDDLLSGKCPFAVASDVALCTFISKNIGYDLSLIPFIRIEDHLKIIVRKKDDTPEYETSDALRGKKIGYYPDSVHDDFLNELGLFNPDLMSPMTNVLDCYHALAVSRNVEACVLWEPHYHAFMRFNDLHILNDREDSPYVWFLCLVAKKDYTLANEEIARRILMATKTSAQYCQSHQSIVIEECAAFLHSEFTGISVNELEKLLVAHNHYFGVDGNIILFINKLNKLGKKGGLTAFGAGTLINSLWPGLQV